MVYITWIFDIFAWDKLSYALTVFGALMTTTIIPIYKLFKKKQSDKAKILDEKETEKIKEISHEMIKPVIDKIDNQQQQQDKLRYTQLENDRNTKDILMTVKELANDFRRYGEQLNKVNAKIAYMDGYMRTRQSQYLNKTYKDYSSHEENGDE